MSSTAPTPYTPASPTSHADVILAALVDLLDPDVGKYTTTRTHSLRAIRAVALLRAHGIHPGQRDAEGWICPPPHDDCEVCRMAERAP
jgi:hypothetical protein